MRAVKTSVVHVCARTRNTCTCIAKLLLTLRQCDPLIDLGSHMWDFEAVSPACHALKVCVVQRAE